MKPQDADHSEGADMKDLVIASPFLIALALAIYWVNSPLFWVPGI